MDNTDPQTSGVIPGTEGLSGASSAGGDSSSQPGAATVQPQSMPAGATQIAPAPQTQPSPAPSSASSAPMAAPGTPHAGLRNMLQSLFEGMDAFATAAATGGKEGGVEEIQKLNAQRQDMALKKQAAGNEQQDHDMRMKLGTADYNMKTATLAQLIADAPLKRQQLYNEVQNATLDLLLKKGVPLSKAVDQVEGQPTETHVASVGQAANGDFTTNHVIPVYGPNGAGKSGGKSVVVGDASTANLRYNSEDLTPSLTALQHVIDDGQQKLGSVPGITVAQGQLDSIKKGLNAGGTISHRDWLGLKNSVQLNVEQPVSQKEGLADFQKKQADAQKAQLDVQAAARPKDLNDAVGRLTQAQQAFKTAPTPENQLGVTAAQTAVNTFQREEAKASAQKTFATKSAELNAVDANESKNLPTLTDAALNYQLDPDKIYGIRGSQRADFLSAMLQKDPTWSMAKYKAKFDTVQDFTPKGKSGQQVMALNTFAGHASDAMELVDTLRNTGSPLINAPMNKVAEALGNDKIGPFNAAMMAAKEEYQNFLKGGHAATKEEIERVEKLGSDSSTPAQNEAILKQMSQTVLIRAGSLNSSYKATMGTDYPNMFNQDGAQAMVKLGHPEVSKFGVAGTVGGPQERKVFGQDGKTVIGYTSDGKTMRPAQ